jgi:hypothetical protein
MVKCGVLFEVRTEFLNIIYTSFVFKGLTSRKCQHACGPPQNPGRGNVMAGPACRTRSLTDDVWQEDISAKWYVRFSRRRM